MIIEFFKTSQERAIEDDYIRCEFGGVLNAATSNAKRLASLGAYDELVVASAATLATDPVNLVWVINQLLQQGVKIHFVEEGIILKAHAQYSACEVLSDMMSLMATLPSLSQPIPVIAKRVCLPSKAHSVGSFPITIDQIKH